MLRKAPLPWRIPAPGAAFIAAHRAAGRFSGGPGCLGAPPPGRTSPRGRPPARSASPLIGMAAPVPGPARRGAPRGIGHIRRPTLARGVRIQPRGPPCLVEDKTELRAQPRAAADAPSPPTGEGSMGDLPASEDGAAQSPDPLARRQRRAPTAGVRGQTRPRRWLNIEPPRLASACQRTTALPSGSGYIITPGAPAPEIVLPRDPQPG